MHVSIRCRMYAMKSGVIRGWRCMETREQGPVGGFVASVRSQTLRQRRRYNGLSESDDAT